MRSAGLNFGLEKTPGGPRIVSIALEYNEGRESLISGGNFFRGIGDVGRSAGVSTGSGIFRSA